MATLKELKLLLASKPEDMLSDEDMNSDLIQDQEFKWGEERSKN